MNAPTKLFFYRILSANQLICRVNQYEYGRECGVCSMQNFFPDQNFQFSIKNFLIFLTLRFIKCLPRFLYKKAFTGDIC